MKRKAANHSKWQRTPNKKIPQHLKKRYCYLCYAVVMKFAGKGENTMQKKNRSYSGTTNPEITPRELEGMRIARKAAEAGIVLLKNENGVLPLKEGKRIALFGNGAGKTIKGGTGSGDVNERSSVSIKDGLDRAGFEIGTLDWIQDYDTSYINAREEWKQQIFKEAEGKDSMAFFQIYADHPFYMPDGRLVDSEDVKKADADTALFVISRVAGEGADRFHSEGDYYLTKAEYRNLTFICQNFPHVILVINTGAQIDLSFTEEFPQIQGILYMVQAGMEGGNALASVISGKVTPSGKLTDTWAKEYKDYPAAATFSHNNQNIENEFYEEGIYVGYRHFQSFCIEPLYPFGYGLSYTDFVIDHESMEVCTECQTVRMKVSVENCGNPYSGKEVVQVYASCPQSGMPKEFRRLCGFQKTSLLKPGEKEELIIGFPVKALASFCEEKSAWILEQGLYGIWVGNSSENLKLIGAFSVAQDTVMEKTTHICPLEAELHEKVRPEEKAAAFEKAWQTELMEKSLPVIPLDVREEHLIFYPKTQAEVLAEELTEKLTDEELTYMVIGEISKSQNSSALGSAGIMVPGAAGETSSILDETYGVPGMPMADGPAGIRLSKSYEVSGENGSIYAKGILDALEGGFFSDHVTHEDAITYYQFCTAIPVGTLLAQTFDPELIQEVGAMVATEMQEFGVTWWLAPGMNIHRDPLCGRNFEYYSEDPVVSGVMAAAMTRGVQSVPGVGTTIKHYACNNQEDNRMGSNSIISERTLREIYLRGFEIAVKTSQPMAMMTSYNRINGVHSANNRDLCTVAAREEWGFKGIIMTDWTTTDVHGGSVPHLCTAAGNDLIMPGSQRDVEDIRKTLADGTLPREEMKACVKRLLTIAFQSNCFEDAVSYLTWFPGMRAYGE